METHSEIVEGATPSGPIAILRKRPAVDEPWPKVVMFHDGPGVRTATHVFAEKLAAEGYDVAVPDLYHPHGRLIGYEPHEREAEPALVDRLWELLRSLTDAGIQDDVDATLAALAVERTERLGTIGFCVGARAVYRTLMRMPDRFVAGAMWHPSFLVDEQPDSPHLTAHLLTQPLFIGIGESDAMQPIEIHRRFLDQVATLAHVEIRTFAGVDHAFTWPDWPTYDDHAASSCFAATVSLLRRAHLD